MTPKNTNGSRRTEGLCIQQQLRCHIEARAAALRGLKHAEDGDRRQALKAQAEAERWYRLYQKYGGKGPLT